MPSLSLLLLVVLVKRSQYVSTEGFNPILLTPPKRENLLVNLYPTDSIVQVHEQRRITSNPPKSLFYMYDHLFKEDMTQASGVASKFLHSQRRVISNDSDADANVPHRLKKYLSPRPTCCMNILLDPPDICHYAPNAPHSANFSEMGVTYVQISQTESRCRN